MVSSNDDTDGDIFKIDESGKVFINSPTSITTGRLNLKGEGSDQSEIGFGINSGGALGTYDMLFDGGTDGRVRFLNAGPNPDDILEFDYLDSDGDLNTIAEIWNDGRFAVAKQIVVGKYPSEVSADTELHLHEKETDHDVFVVLSDQNTVTGFNDPEQYFLTPDVIGFMTPYKDLLGPCSPTQKGGLEIVGVSDGDTGQEVPGLTMVGAIGNTVATMPAIDVEGLKTDASGNFALYEGSETVFSVNYFNNSPSDSIFKISADGKVGIGFTQADTPQAALHVRSAMMLDPLTNPPACNTSDEDGTLYVDDSGALCFCFGGSWHTAAGTGSCN